MSKSEEVKVSRDDRGGERWVIQECEFERVAEGWMCDDTYCQNSLSVQFGCRWGSE